VEDAYNREEYLRSHPGRMQEVLKRQEAAKHRHEFGVEADFQTSPIGEGSNDLSAAVVRKVTVSEHIVCVCVCV
jgi:hypothetical protein